MFPPEIEAAYRVVETRYGKGDAERTIPLGSWRKGGGLAGKRGNVYEHGTETAGVWLIRLAAAAWVREQLSPLFPNLVLMQDGDREATFRVPMNDLDRLLPLIGAKKRAKASEAVLATLAKARAASPIARKPENDVATGH